MPRRVNLVFQGGGVKGIAFAGALAGFEAKTKQIGGAFAIDAVAGTSAGSIVAALYAAGYTASELKSLMEQTSFASLIANNSLLPVGIRIARNKGAYSTTSIENWLRPLFQAKGKKLLTDLTIKCKIVTANITEGTLVVYSSSPEKEEKNADIVDAILRSISIPIFFEPYPDGSSLYVDGGLLSNYPTWLFRDTEYPTIGFKFSDEWRGASQKSNVLEYGRSLVGTVLRAHDALSGHWVKDAFEISIDSAGVSATDFETVKAKEPMLYQNGLNAAKDFDWSSIPDKKRRIFLDPRPEEVLDAMADAVDKIFQNHSGDASYAGYEVRVSVHSDGATTIKRKFTVTNATRDISMLDFKYTMERPVDFSFNDLKFSAQCPTGGQDTALLPREKGQQRVRGAVVLVPPIPKGESRELEITCTIPGFCPHFAEGKEDVIEFRVDHAGLDGMKIVVESGVEIRGWDIRGTTPTSKEELKNSATYIYSPTGTTKSPFIATVRLWPS